MALLSSVPLQQRRAKHRIYYLPKVDESIHFVQLHRLLLIEIRSLQLLDVRTTHTVMEYGCLKRSPRATDSLLGFIVSLYCESVRLNDHFLPHARTIKIINQSH